MNEQHELEEIKCVKCGDDKNVPEETAVYEINDQLVGPSGENVPCMKIMDNYGQRRQYYNQGGEQMVTTYYQQQRVGGQPVYVRGYALEPGNAVETYPYRYGQVQRDYPVETVMFIESFNGVALRNKFIQRVYAILTIQLICTCGFISLCVLEPSVKRGVLSNMFLFFMSMIIFFIILIILMFLDSGRKSFPINFILLGILTITMAYQMGFLSALNSTQVVMMSMAITAGVCLVISIIACGTSFDLTGCGIYLCILGAVLSIFFLIAIIVILVTGSTILFVIYAALIGLLFSLYLIYDTQMIMGGHRIELAPEEYIFGAVTLYLDIIYILWSIMTILNACDK